MSAALEGAGDAPDLLQVTVLAVLQGLTEFLPVSSSGHHVLAEHLLGVHESGLTLPVALHLGTLIAVLAVYRRAIAAMLRDVLAGRLGPFAMVLLGSVPAGLAGILLEDWFEARFGEPRTAGFGLLVTALVLFVSDAARRGAPAPAEAREPGVKEALLIGLAQAAAILPGISRSGSTIGVGLLCGLRPSVAARYSFVLSLVAVGGASLLEARKLARDGLQGDATGGPLLLWGVALSALTGWFALRLLLAFLERGAFRWFALYCAAVGVAVLAWL